MWPQESINNALSYDPTLISMSWTA